MKGTTAVVHTDNDGGDVQFISGNGSREGRGGDLVFCVGGGDGKPVQEVVRFTWHGDVVVNPMFDTTEAARHFWRVLHEMRASLGTSGLKTYQVDFAPSEIPAEDDSLDDLAAADHRDYVNEMERSKLESEIDAVDRARREIGT